MEFNKAPLLHQSLGPSVFLSFFLPLSFSFWLIPWSMKAGCITQGILASFLLSLSHHRLWATRFRSSKGPTSGAQKQGLWYTWQDSDGVTPEGLSRPVSTKTWVNRLERQLTFLLYIITYLKFKDFQFHNSK